MKKFAFLLFCSLVAAGCQQDSGVASNARQQSAALVTDAVAADSPESIIAVVNGVEIPASRIALYAQGTQVTEANRDAIINNIVTSELITQAAKNSGVADLAEVREELVIAEQTVLGRAYVNDFFQKTPIGDAEIDARYQKMAEEAKGQQEYNVAHILVEEEDAANALLEQIREDPESFAKLAADNSKDPGSAAQGGQLGWVAPQGLVPEFSAAMSELKAGELASAPVQTEFGWHIIRVDERRDIQIPPLTPELRQRIEQGERADVFSRHIEELRAAAKVELR